MAHAFSAFDVTNEIVPGRPFFNRFPDYDQLGISFDDYHLQISFPEEYADLKGSVALTELDYEFTNNTIKAFDKGVTRLPHNLCLSILNTAYAEGTVQLPSLQTPDYVRVEEGSILIGELKTSSNNNEKAMNSTLDAASQKYSSQCDRIFLIGVISDDVITRGIALDDSVKAAMIKACRVGNMILDKLPKTFSYDRSGRDITHADDAIRSISFTERGIDEVPEQLRITPEYMVSQSSLTGLVLSGGVLKVPEQKTFQSWLDGLPGRRVSCNSFVHQPMVLLVDDDEYEGHPVSSDVCDMGSLWEQVLFERSHRDIPNPTHEILRQEQKMRKMNSWGKKTMKEMREDPDNHSVPLSDSFAAELAFRGLNAKAHLKEVTAYRHEERMESKVGFSKDLDDSALTFWLSEPLRVKQRRLPLDDADFWIGDKDWTKATLQELWSTEIVEACDNLDMIVREVCYNSRRNQERSKTRLGFILRKVPGKPMYVLIKPTRGQGFTFFSIFFKGKEFAPGIFQRCLSHNSSWMFTEFISLDPDRSSHLVNLPSQAMSLWSMLADVLGEKGLDPEANTSIFEPQTVRAFKIMLAILIEDKEDTSTTLQLLRYYYMKVMSGSPSYLFPKEEMVAKLPDVIRSPVLMHIIKTWSKIDLEVNERTSNNTYLAGPISAPDIICCYCDGDHSGVLCPKINYKVLEHHVEEDGAFKEDEEEEIVYDDDELFDKMPPVPSPFGFIIDSSEKFLLSAYVCMLHNKDEGEDFTGSLKSYSKLIKMEELLREKLDVAGWVPETSNPQSFYEFDPVFIRAGADLIKEDLRSRSALPPDIPFRTSALGNLAGLTIEGFATTKATTKSIYTGDAKMNNPEEVEKRMSVRTKCFAAIYEMLPILLGVLLIDSLGLLYTETLFSGFVLVSIFKKNQIGGVREISILDMYSRLRLASLEAIATGICTDLEEECLTKPKQRKRFVSSHERKVKEAGNGDQGVTIRMSMDMKTWCQCFLMKMFACLYSHLLPVEYFGYVANTLNSMSAKKVEMPKTMYREIIKGPSTTMFDKVIEKVRNIFWGLVESKFMKGSKTYATLAGNMLQGILHYTSSLYHVALLHVFKKLVSEAIEAMGFSSVISFQVSSDDEGVLITILPGSSGENPRLHKGKIRKILRIIRRIKDLVDSKFGLRTSWEKSSVSLSTIYEFNSVFYIGNTMCSQLIKFTARACDDPPEDNLHKRVANMLSSLASLRDSGACGSLCSLVSGCQVIALQRNLGRGTMTWWDDKCTEMVQSGVSVMGGLKVFPPSSAGLVDCGLLNFSSMGEGDSKQSRLVRQFQLYTDLVEDDLPLIKTEFQLWSKDKHKALLERLGIEKTDLTKDDVRVMISKPLTMDDLRKRMEISSCRSSISRSFLFPKRSEGVRISPFLLWTGCLREGEEEGKISLIELWDNCIPEPSSHGLYINESSYWSIIKFLKIPLSYSWAKESKMKERTFRGYRPKEDEFILVKQVIGLKWFGTTGVSITQANMLFAKYMNLIPWLKETYEQTVLSDEFQGSHDALLSALESLGAKKTSRVLLCRSAPSDTIALETLHRRNNFRKFMARQLHEGEQKPNTAALEIMRKIGRLVVLMQNTDHKPSDEVLRVECVRILKSINLPGPNWARKDLQNPILSVMRILKGNGFVNEDMIREHLKETKDVYWKTVQEIKNGRRVGVGLSYQYTAENGWVRTHYLGEEITRISRERGSGAKLRTKSDTFSTMSSEILNLFHGLLPAVQVTPYGFRIGLWETDLCTEWNEKMFNDKKYRIEVVAGERYALTAKTWGPKIPFSTLYREGHTPSTSLMDKWLASQSLGLSDLTSGVSEKRDVECRNLIMGSVIPRMKPLVMKPLPLTIEFEESKTEAWDLDEDVMAEFLDEAMGGDGGTSEDDEDVLREYWMTGDSFLDGLVSGRPDEIWDDSARNERSPERGLDTQLGYVMNTMLKRLKTDDNWTVPGFERELDDVRTFLREEEERFLRMKKRDDEEIYKQFLDKKIYDFEDRP